MTRPALPPSRLEFHHLGECELPEDRAGVPQSSHPVPGQWSRGAGPALGTGLGVTALPGKDALLARSLSQNVGHVFCLIRGSSGGSHMCHHSPGASPGELRSPRFLL